jgi:hypothetical protein
MPPAGICGGGDQQWSSLLRLPAGIAGRRNLLDRPRHMIELDSPLRGKNALAERNPYEGDAPEGDGRNESNESSSGRAARVWGGTGR